MKTLVSNGSEYSRSHSDSSRACPMRTSIPQIQPSIFVRQSLHIVARSVGHIPGFVNKRGSNVTSLGSSVLRGKPGAGPTVGPCMGAAGAPVIGFRTAAAAADPDMASKSSSICSLTDFSCGTSTQEPSDPTLVRDVAGYPSSAAMFGKEDNLHNKVFTVVAQRSGSGSK